MLPSRRGLRSRTCLGDPVNRPSIYDYRREPVCAKLNSLNEKAGRGAGAHLAQAIERRRQQTK